MIVIDSIAFHYRAVTPTSSKYYLERTKQLTSLAGYLSDLAREHNLAIVCINQMTTKLTNQKTTSSLIPALGESWAHAVTTRLLLKQGQQQQETSDIRTCTLVKSPHRAAGSAQFRVLKQGIRGAQIRMSQSMTQDSSSTTRKSPNPQHSLGQGKYATHTDHHNNKRLRTH